MTLAALIAASFSAQTHAENTASQIELINCGGYTIANITVQFKESDSSKKGWQDAYLISRDLKIGTAVCVDLNPHGRTRLPDEYRLNVKIGAGDRVKCDGTNYDPEGGRRMLIMKGSTRNNNGCRTIEYREASAQCDSYGQRKTIDCTNL